MSMKDSTPDLATLDETITQLASQAEALKQNNGALSKVTSLVEEINKGVVELHRGNDNFDTVKQSLKVSLESFNNHIVTLGKQNDKHIDDLVSTTKKFSRDLEGDVSSKISKFSSDIQVTVRTENKELADKQTQHFEKQKERFDTQAKQLAALRILLFVSIAISIGLGVIVLVKY